MALQHTQEFDTKQIHRKVMPKKNDASACQMLPKEHITFIGYLRIAHPILTSLETTK